MTREQVKELWKLCFNDDEAFVDMYFRLRYNNEVNIAIESGDEVIAALQMIPYPMTFCGNVLSTSYISGACTHPDYRNRGVMRELLSQAFGRMYRSDVTLSTLIPAEPWLFDYYAHMGYAAVFYNHKKIFHLPADHAELHAASSTWELHIGTQFDQSAYEYLKRKLEERPCCIQHTQSDFQVILEDLRLSQGSMYVLSDNNVLIGLAMVYPSEDTSSMHIDEIVADRVEVEQYLLSLICQKENVKSLVINAPANGVEQRTPVGMARIIQPKSILQLYATVHPEVEMNITLVDEQISSNNAHYYLNKGKCMSSRKKLPGSHVRMNVAKLTEWVFAADPAFMSLMLS